MGILRKRTEIAVPCPDFARLRGWRQDVRWPACVLNVEAVPVPAPDEWAAEYNQDWRMRVAMVGFGWWDSPKSQAMRVEMLADADMDDGTESDPNIPDPAEEKFLGMVADKLNLYRSAVYVATRDFDESVLEGRFINRQEKLTDIELAWPILLWDDLTCRPRNILSACQQHTCEFSPNPQDHLPQDLWAQAWLYAEDAADRKPCWRHMLTDLRRTAEQCKDLSIKVATHDEKKAKDSYADFRRDAGLDQQQ